MMLIGPNELAKANGRRVDVRNLDEFAAERVPGFECVPLGRLLEAANGWDRNEDVLVMCKSGMRSRQAAQQLEQAGFSRVHMLEGGIEACKKAGVDVIIERKRIPIIRQVLIMAGVTMLIGLGLALVNPWFLAIDWLVAAGLVFSGATGVCPMARLLERMPWNAGASCQTGASCAA